MNLLNSLEKYQCMPGHPPGRLLFCIQPNCKERGKVICEQLCIPYYHKNHKVIELDIIQSFLQDFLNIQEPVLHDSIQASISSIRTLQKEVNILIDNIIDKIKFHFGRFTFKAYQLAQEFKSYQTVERIQQLSQEICEIASINDKIVKIKVIKPIEPLTIDQDLKLCISKLAGFNIGRHDAQATRPEDQVNFYHSHQRILQADGEVWCMDTSKNGLLATAGDDRKVTIWNMDTLERLWSTKKHSSTITAICFSTDFSTLISGSIIGDMKIWNMEKKNLIKKISQAHQGKISSISYSNNNKCVVTSGWDTKLKLWTFNEDAQVEMAEFQQGHSDKIYCASYSPDNTLIASCSLDKTIKLWESVTLTQSGDSFKFEERMDQLVFTLNQKYLISCSTISNNIVIISLKDREIIQSFKPGHSPHRITISPDSKLLISSHKDIRVFDLSTRLMVGDPIQGHAYFIWCLKQSRDGRYIISSCQDGSIKIYGLPK